MMNKKSVYLSARSDKYTANKIYTVYMEDSAYIGRNKLYKPTIFDKLYYKILDNLSNIPRVIEVEDPELRDIDIYISEMIINIDNVKNSFKIGTTIMITGNVKSEIELETYHSSVIISGEFGKYIFAKLSDSITTSSSNVVPKYVIDIMSMMKNHIKFDFIMNDDVIKSVKENMIKIKVY